MPRFFLHLKQGSQVVKDHEGSVFASAQDAHAWGVRAAREVCAEAIKYGKELAVDALIIADESGQRSS